MGGENDRFVNSEYRLDEIEEHVQRTLSQC